jgi:hypothetical protein
MKSTGRYCPVEDQFDLDQEINIAVDKTRKFVANIREITETEEQARAILKAIAETVIQEV